jgi:hypothetical protein
MVTKITPNIPSGGINRRARGTPMQRVNMFNFINILVSPRPDRRLPILKFPKIANKLLITNKLRKEDANNHLPAYIVLIIGADNTIRAMVDGTKKRAVYLIEDAKTALRSCGSFCRLSFEKAGNRTVDMGIVKKVNNMAKLVATR